MYYFRDGTNDMELYQLIYFREVAITRNYTKAAEKLSISQPTVSIAVRKLEEELGITLFVKKSNPVTLTDAGKHILEKADNIIKDIRNIQTIAEDFQRQENRQIRIGLPITLGSEVLIKLKKDFVAAYPDILISIVQHPMPDLSERLTAGELDLAMISTPIPYSNIRFKHLKDAELHAVFPADSDLNELKTLTPADLKDKQLIIFGDPNVKDISFHVEKYLKSNKVQAEILPLGIVPPFSARNMAAENMGIALLEKEYAKQNGQNLACRPLDPPLLIPTVLAWNSKTILTQNQKTLLQFLLDQFH